MATFSNCWNFLRAFTTTLIPKGFRGTRLIVVHNGKNVNGLDNQQPSP